MIKRLLFFSISLILSVTNLAISQEKDAGSFTIVGDMPEYPGGDEALLRYIAEEANYPVECLEKGIIGCVFVSYTINRLGKVENAHVVLSGNELFDKEALRVVNSISGYKPGLTKGKPVPVQFTVPLRFAFTGCSEESKLKLDKKIAIQLYNLGVKEYAQENYGLAESLFWQSLQNSGSWFHEAFIARGKAYLMTKKYNEALSDFESALKIEPKLYDAHLEKAKTYVLLKDQENAVKSMRNALKIKKTSVYALQYLSEVYYANSEYDLALKYFEKLVALDQSQGLVYYHLGLCYARKRDINKTCENMRLANSLGLKEAELFVQSNCTGK
jgi:TonB family protein